MIRRPHQSWIDFFVLLGATTLFLWVWLRCFPAHGQNACNSEFDFNALCAVPRIGEPCTIEVQVIAGPINGDGSGYLYVREMDLLAPGLTYNGDKTIEFNDCPVMWVTNIDAMGVVHFRPSPLGVLLALPENQACRFSFTLTPTETGTLWQYATLLGQCTDFKDTYSWFGTDLFVQPACVEPVMEKLK